MKSETRSNLASPARQVVLRGLALDDPVPSGSAVCEFPPCLDQPHDIEAEVQRVLLANPQLDFTSLVVRRVPQGVCLEGVVRGSSSRDVVNLARTVKGVDVVINHLLMCADR